MNELLLVPDDVLFFRDGRPMTGSLSGHGARLPEPHVLSGALHVACHRAFQDDPGAGHRHRFRRRGTRQAAPESNRGERFGALTNAGPFPVKRSEDSEPIWYFPIPSDLTAKTLTPGLLPMRPEELLGESSLPEKLWPLANQFPPSKVEMPQWLSKEGFESYLRAESAQDAFLTTGEVFTAEATMGIGMDPETGATRDGAFFTKSQLRFHRDFCLGTYASLPAGKNSEGDLLSRLFPSAGRISLGGESRVCSVDRREPEEISFPQGPKFAGNYVKWVLLSPAIFPHLPAENSRTSSHPGGWLPSWINEETFAVEMLDGPGRRKAERLNLKPGQPIRARLVAARIAHGLPVTGWTLGREERSAGARSTLLGVPAGSVYYFEAENESEAQKLADALNWHGPLGENSGTRIVNRRSALMGEKGYGIGVCGSWQPAKSSTDVG
ncbi:MAG TPA: type III-B CRISPR module-associated Cmr3 family protein [Opitutales bacterium]|nr:type III-B CRISPR module-associated Cmr3 family protein [Opitutales bacterium]